MISFSVVMGRKFCSHQPSFQKAVWRCCPPSLALGHRASGAAQKRCGVCVSKHLERGSSHTPSLQEAFPADRPGCSQPFIREVLTPVRRAESPLHLRSGNPCSPRLGHRPSGRALCASQIVSDSWGKQSLSPWQHASAFQLGQFSGFVGP